MRGTMIHVDRILVLIIAWLLFVLACVGTAALHGPHDKDVVFICPPTVDRTLVRADPIACATTVWFNGDWRNSQFCHGQRCWQYGELFPEAK